MEEEYFQSFQYFEPDARSLRFAHADGSLHDGRPDFLAELESRTLGVEVTQVVKRVAKSIESTEERIFDEACRQAFERKLPPADVYLFFNVQRPLSARARSQIATALVEVVQRHMPADGESVELDCVRDQPREVDLILINRVHSRPPGRWDFDTSGIVDRGESHLIQEAINRKAAKFNRYMTCCSECWLLIVADSFRGSARFSFDDLDVRTYLSPFERSYLLDFGRGKLHRLRTVGA